MFCIASEELRDQSTSVLSSVSCKAYLIPDPSSKENERQIYPFGRAHFGKIPSSVQRIPAIPFQRPLTRVALNSLFKRTLKMASPDREIALVRY